MKKNIFFLIAALLALASCSSMEEPQVNNNPNGEETEVVFSFNLNAESPVSRAVSYGEGSPSVMTTLDYAIYDVTDMSESKPRVLVMHSAQPDAPKAETQVDTYEKPVGEFMLKVDLLKQHTYEIVVFAHSGENSPYTFDADNRKITMDYAKMKAFDETCDAFYGKHTYTIADKENNVNKDDQEAINKYRITLNRPFAQINVLTTDIKEAKRVNEGGLASVSVTFNKNIGTYTSLSFDDNLCSVPTESPLVIATTHDGWTTAENLIGRTIILNEIQTDYYYLTSFFILTGVVADSNNNRNSATGAAGETTDLTLKFTYKDGTSTSLPLQNIPIQRNWRTNIYGDLLTSRTNIRTVLDPEFNVFMNDKYVNYKDRDTNKPDGDDAPVSGDPGDVNEE